MSRYSDEERQRILAQSRETRGRLDPSSSVEGDERPADQVMVTGPPVEPPTEKLSMKHRRELTAQEKRFRIERLARKRQEQQERERQVDGWARALSDQRVEELQSTLTEVLRETTTCIER